MNACGYEEASSSSLYCCMNVFCLLKALIYLQNNGGF